MSSLCDKLMCLGKRQELESLKSKLMGWLTDVSLIDFENISMYQNNEDQDQVKYFLDWVDRNKIYATADEVVANIDANKQRLNLANIKLNEFKDMWMKVRELATLAADDAHTAEQRLEFKAEADQIIAQIESIKNELQFNSKPVFNVAYSVRDNLESGTRKNYNVIYNPKGAVNFNDSVNADAETNAIDTELVTLEAGLNAVESCYKELCRTRENILRQKAQGYKNLESQRAQAKQHVEKKICNLMNQVAYLNVCISHNGH